MSDSASEQTHDRSADEQVDHLIQGPQYSMSQAEKDSLLVPILRRQCRRMAECCEPYGRFLERFGGDPDAWQTPADVPPLPVTVFKKFLLSAVPPDKVVRRLQSSATTGQQPSRIAIDKPTAFRQIRALASTLKEHLGPRRRPFLVLDTEDSLGDDQNLPARGAAIRGIGNFATETVLAMRSLPSGDLDPNFNAIQAFFEKHRTAPVLLFGFTFIVWTRFVLEAERRGLTFHAPDAVLLHSGGWKKLKDQAVSKDEFARRVAALLGCRPDSVLDFYGMVEVVGTVFVDCEAGNKHAPAFADVIIRRPYTLEPVENGESGIIEVVSTLPSSYPGQALITEDQGVLLGVDDCPCGRRGRYFRFTSRIERVEVRGCGDTFAQSREVR